MVASEENTTTLRFHIFTVSQVIDEVKEYQQV